MVYKLVAHLDESGGWLPVGKKSDGKATVGGRKQPVRALRDGVAVGEDIYVEDPPADAAAGRPLLVSLVDAGEVVVPLGAAGVAAARTHHAAAMAELPVQALSLSRGEPAIPTRYL
jgi:nicotinate phosphoribosyltransferase